MIVKRKAPEIVVEYEDAKFHFHVPNALESVGLMDAKGSSRALFQELFGLLNSVEGLKDEDGAPIGKDRVLDIGTDAFISIGSKFITQLAAYREAEEKKELSTPQ